MYIITKKKDYYDGVAGTTGIDKTIVYDRQIIEFEDADIPNLFKSRNRYVGVREEKANPFYVVGNANITPEAHKIYPVNAYFIIGFCGKLYLGWKLYKSNPTTESAFDTVITYDQEYIKTIFKNMGYHYNLTDTLNYVNNYNAMDMFRELNAPCFVYDEDWNRTYINLEKPWLNKMHHKFIINPLLKEYEFFKLFNAFQAFQEIQMFISGVLGNKEKEIVVIDDKYKIEQHGFDKKWSFRKEPQKPKH